ncbi:uncharacterized protein AB675_3267 [Cyphellophora attinorum]|uniref:Uncharacterized protein n=1 Tax=Cyphellophora attinorum TaxID=1664694 RepID=A0A0N1HTG4_9EURO|nr:uncharacterized protein AB675_3267 [Phialophora attinorum]KPI39803.1 hypothetical protein AB675_3267 [Phialophora attinorum]
MPAPLQDEPTQDVEESSSSESTQRLSLEDLPTEVQGKVIDYIFGDMHSVSRNTHSLRGKNVSSLMRHPRRKAVSDLALVSREFRTLVQERIYRHIKIKGTRGGLKECEDFFSDNWDLRKYVRHIEVWVPVWGDKGSLANDESFAVLRTGAPRHFNYPLAHQPEEMAVDRFGLFVRPVSSTTATLEEIFDHIAVFFAFAKVFTLEGGHCKKSNMIRHFKNTLVPAKTLTKLPSIRTFAIRGAWNVMRDYNHWPHLQEALPNVEEWHCSYAKPRLEAELVINYILLSPPHQWRSVNICLDGMYSKDTSTLSSSSKIGDAKQLHLCERLGDLIPQLESLSFTGKVCECLWMHALKRLNKSRTDCRLQSLEIVVKSCCRRRVTTVDTVTGEELEEEIGGFMADTAGISNLVFIKAFERLVLGTVEALKWAVNLKYVRIRYIDLDSECTHLNPYWILDGDYVWGIWSEEIVERLGECRPSAQFVELGDGIQMGGGSNGKVTEESSTTADEEGEPGSQYGPMINAAVNAPGAGGLIGPAGHHAGHGYTIHGLLNPPQPHPHGGGVERSVTSLYPRLKPKSIKTSSYKILAEARGS